MRGKVAMGPRYGTLATNPVGTKRRTITPNGYLPTLTRNERALLIADKRNDGYKWTHSSVALQDSVWYSLYRSPFHDNMLLDL